jgi:redox-regulated HSP33 family molecular chaperone
MNEKIKRIGLQILGGVSISLGLAFGLTTNEMDFQRYFVLSMIGCAVGIFWWDNRKQKDDRVVELENQLEKKQTDERVVQLEKMLQEADGVMVEQEEVIKNYESMLEEASVRFPCNCGQNMFEGIFKPEVEYEVDCDACNNKYAITLKLDSVLITEPIEDLNINKLIETKINDKH